MNENVMVLAAADGAPQMDITFSDDVVSACRAISSIAALCWVIYALGRNILPGGRGGGQGMQMMMGQQSSGMKILLAVVGVMMFMDVNLFISVTNFVLEQLWALKDMLADGDLDSLQ